jgi:YggT family protein
MINTLLLVLEILFGLATLLFVARFLLQATGADFYNPLSQAIVKATDPICRPLRGVLKPLGNLDLASILVAWLVSSVYYAMVLWLRAPEFLSVSLIAWSGLIDTLMTLIQFFIFSIIIIAIASFVAQGSMNPALSLLHQLNEPLMAPLRKIIPPFGVLDLTPMLVLIILFVVRDILSRAY